MLHSQGFMGYRETKKEHSLSFPENLTSIKREFRFSGGVRKLLRYSWLSFFSVLFRDICFFPSNNFKITKSFSSTSFSCFTTLQIAFFLELEFQPPPASLDLIHFPFDTVLILRVGFLKPFIVVSFIFCFWKYSSQCPHKKFFFFAKIGFSTRFRADHIESLLPTGN